MGLVDKQCTFTENLAYLIFYAKSIGIRMSQGEGYRTEDQQQLYFNGETVEIIDGELELVRVKPKSKTMNSQHLKRLAHDYNFFIDGKLTYDKELIKPLGDYWESLHEDNVWGGSWGWDVPHFEMKG